MQNQQRKDAYWLMTAFYCFLPSLLFNFFWTFAAATTGGLEGIGVGIYFLFSLPVYLVIATAVIHLTRTEVRPTSVPIKGHWLKIFLLILLSLFISFFVSLPFGQLFGYDYKVWTDKEREIQRAKYPYGGGEVFIIDSEPLNLK